MTARNVKTMSILECMGEEPNSRNITPAPREHWNSGNHMFPSLRSRTFGLRRSLRALSGEFHFPIWDRQAGPWVRFHQFRDSVSLQTARTCLVQSVIRFVLGALLLLPLVAALFLF